MKNHGFILWITGLPASGKSSITRALAERLQGLGVFPVVLESDRLRTVLTPRATYSDDERDRFYHQVIGLAAEIARSSVPVIIDATGNKRRYREEARALPGRFIEVLVNSPLELCAARDPKGIYAAARAGRAANVPGAQSPYEPSPNPELVVDGAEPPELNAVRILAFLEARGCV